MRDDQATTAMVALGFAEAYSLIQVTGKRFLRGPQEKRF